MRRALKQETLGGWAGEKGQKTTDNSCYEDIVFSDNESACTTTIERERDSRKRLKQALIATQ